MNYNEMYTISGILEFKNYKKYDTETRRIYNIRTYNIRPVSGLLYYLNPQYWNVSCIGVVNNPQYQ